MRKLFLIICGLVFSLPCLAGDYVGLIKPQLWNGTLYLHLTSMSLNQPPSCAWRAVVKLQEASGTQAYKDKYALILAAWFAQTPLALKGTGACDAEGDELIYAIWP